MASISIREAERGDTALILHFITELAIYERAADEVVATRDALERTLFDAQATARALICEVDGQAAGFAVYFFNYSTWQGRNGLYLEDLYVSPEHRGCGAGKALLKHLARIAVASGCGRFEWSVLDWNRPAIEFYQAIGAQARQEWVKYRLAGAALEAFAREDTPTRR